ncbi:MAG: glycosyltransferase [Patescibacteria group bacterium]|nr:glycosyltransferase [Patescibacteria group bacterium]
MSSFYTVKVSIVVPAYNEEEVLGPCLQTIRHSIAEASLEENDYEIIVVNNVSTDRTREIASATPGVRVVDEPRKGLTRAKEAGFRAARGELIAHPDADTLMPPHWLSFALSEFERSPHLVALSGPYIYYDATGLSRLVTRIWLTMGFLFHLVIRDILHKGAMVQGGNYIARRSALEAIQGYDTSIEFYGEDFDIATRLLRVGKVKWTWKFYMYSSSRRLAAEGSIITGLRYGANNIASVFLRRPLMQTYTDIRPKLKARAQEAADTLIRTGRL